MGIADPVPDAPAPKPKPDPYWYTGYGGTPKHEPQQSGGVYFGSTPGSPMWQATAGAYQAKNDDYEKALAALRAGQFMPAGLPGAAMNMFTNPRGFDPIALRNRMAALADTEAGSRMNNLQQLENAASARGFRNSVGALDAAARVRAGSAANLMRSQNEVFYEGERAKLAQQGIAGGILGGLSAQEAAMLRALAEANMDRPRDVIPGISQGPDGKSGGWQYLNERGEIIPRQGWTQQDWEAAMRERQMYMLYGRAA